MSEKKRVRVVPIKFNSVEIWHNMKGRLVFNKRNPDGTTGKEMWEDEALEVVRANPRKLTIFQAVREKGKPVKPGRGNVTAPIEDVEEAEVVSPFADAQ